MNNRFYHQSILINLSQSKVKLIISYETIGLMMNKYKIKEEKSIFQSLKSFHDPFLRFSLPLFHCFAQEICRITNSRWDFNFPSRDLIISAGFVSHPVTNETNRENVFQEYLQFLWVQKYQSLFCFENNHFITACKRVTNCVVLIHGKLGFGSKKVAKQRMCNIKFLYLLSGLIKIKHIAWMICSLEYFRHWIFKTVKKVHI